jgi:DNA repair exonuclease SbcCD ATPase subunit
MSDAWRVASLKSFEHVPVGAAAGLLRVAAESASSLPVDGPRPTLVADDGQTVSRFVAIPAPPDTDSTLRAAYSVPVEAVTPETVFSLEFEDGFVIALPGPVQGPARVEAPAAPEAEAPPEPTPAGEERRSDFERKLAELSEDLADARRETGELRADAELGHQARAQVLRLQVESAQLQAELRAVGDLEALAPTDPRLADADEHIRKTRRQLADAQEHAAEATARADAAMRELTGERAQRHDLEDRIAALESEVRSATERLVQAEHDREQAIAAQRHAEESVEPLQAANARAEAELDQLRDQGHKMTLEREELTRQAAAFDGVAVKARERAAEAEGQQRRATARLEELEIWSSELERRLAETTTQLAEARSAAQHDDSELRRLRGELAEAQARIELGQTGTSSLDGIGSAAPGTGASTPAIDLETLAREAVAEADRHAAQELSQRLPGELA